MASRGGAVRCHDDLRISVSVEITAIIEGPMLTWCCEVGDVDNVDNVSVTICDQSEEVYGGVGVWCNAA